MKAILVTTQHRGVFFGLVPDKQKLTERSMRLESARMAIYWGTTKGVAQLAETGPTSSSKIGAPATVTVHDITAVWEVTEKALAQWNNF